MLDALMDAVAGCRGAAEELVLMVAWGNAIGAGGALIAAGVAWAWMWRASRRGSRR